MQMIHDTKSRSAQCALKNQFPFGNSSFNWQKKIIARLIEEKNACSIKHACCNEKSELIQWLWCFEILLPNKMQISSTPSKKVF